MPLATQLATNYRIVLDRIAKACARAGRAPEEVALVAVTKSAELPWINSLVEMGVRDLGESRPQQLIERAARVDEPSAGGAVRWHLIGPLQRNKVRGILPLVETIHSIDSLRLLERVDAVAAELRPSPQLLLEVNVSGEASKGGFAPDEIVASWTTILSCRHVRIAGLMTMAPLVENAEETRPVFRSLRELRDRLQGMSPEDVILKDLSMGMSHDFDVAVEEGATLVRVGSLLFENLPPGAASGLCG
jgi:pyridoxal phosphate enzyme (YggS family)